MTRLNELSTAFYSGFMVQFCSVIRPCEESGNVIVRAIGSHHDHTWWLEAAAHDLAGLSAG
jgi:hypothetical protein